MTFGTLAVLVVVLGLTGCVASKPDSGRVFDPGRVVAQAALIRQMQGE